jgi:hypothetical protein
MRERAEQRNRHKAMQDEQEREHGTSTQTFCSFLSFLAFAASLTSARAADQSAKIQRRIARRKHLAVIAGSDRSRRCGHNGTPADCFPVAGAEHDNQGKTA